MRIEKLKAEHHVKVEWVHFPLHPDTPAEGRSLADLFAGRNMDLKALHAQMKARMDAEGLPYGERAMTYNSRLAQELGKWADTQPGGEAIHGALFRAYFVEARDISQPAVLLDIARQVGRRPLRCRRCAALRGAGAARAEDRAPGGRRRVGSAPVAPYVGLMLAEMLTRQSGADPTLRRDHARRPHWTAIEPRVHESRPQKERAQTVADVRTALQHVVQLCAEAE